MDAFFATLGSANPSFPLVFELDVCQSRSLLKNASHIKPHCQAVPFANKGRERCLFSVPRNWNLSRERAVWKYLKVKCTNGIAGSQAACVNEVWLHQVRALCVMDFAKHTVGLGWKLRPHTVWLTLSGVDLGALLQGKRGNLKALSLPPSLMQVAVLYFCERQ